VTDDSVRRPSGRRESAWDTGDLIRGTPIRSIETALIMTAFGTTDVRGYRSGTGRATAPTNPTRTG